MSLKEGHVAYVHKHTNAAVTITAPKRIWHGPEQEYDPGFTAHFRGNLFTTDDPAQIKAMDNHRKYGVTFQRVATAHDFEKIKEHGAHIVRFMRGPATTVAERLGAPANVPPDTTKISEIAPPPKKPMGPKGAFGKIPKEST